MSWLKLAALTLTLTLSGGERIPDIEECSRRCDRSPLESNFRRASGGFMLEAGDSTVELTVRLQADHALQWGRGCTEEQESGDGCTVA